MKPTIAIAVVLCAACSGKVASTSEGNGGSSAFGGLPTFGGGAGGTGGVGGGLGGIPNGGSGGSGGGEEFVRVGHECAVNAECGVSQFCAEPTSTLFDGEGPAKGYCTLDCTKGPEACDELGPGFFCMSFESGAALCLEKCTPGPASLNYFDPDKCHGRADVACRPLLDSSGMIVDSVCFPQCNHDQDCGEGLNCNPKTGLCTGTLPSGLPLGSACTPALDGGKDPCAGTCSSLVSDSGQVANLCTRGCVLGAAPACEWGGPGTGPAASTCSHAAFPGENTGLGDQASCGKLCSCDADCGVAALGCAAWPGPEANTLEEFFHQKGYCSFLETPDAGIGCN